MVDLKRKKLVLAFIYHFVLTMFAGLAVGGNVSIEEDKVIESNVSIKIEMSMCNSRASCL